MTNVVSIGVRRSKIIEEWREKAVAVQQTTVSFGGARGRGNGTKKVAPKASNLLRHHKDK